MTFDFRAFFEAAISIFAIVNPIGGLPVFVALTEDIPPAERRRIFRIAGLTALTIVLAMALAGQLLIDAVFHLRMNEFTFGGGLLLVVTGIRTMLSSTDRTAAASQKEYLLQDGLRLAVSPIASPLLVGPGTIVTVMLLVQQSGHLFAIASSLAAFAVVILILNYAHVIFRLMGPLGALAVGRVMHIFIVAIGVKFCFRGLEEFIRQWK